MVQADIGTTTEDFIKAVKYLDVVIKEARLKVNVWYDNKSLHLNSWLRVYALISDGRLGNLNLLSGKEFLRKISNYD